MHQGLTAGDRGFYFSGHLRPRWCSTAWCIGAMQGTSTNLCLETLPPGLVIFDLLRKALLEHFAEGGLINRANGAVPCVCKSGARVSSTEPHPHHDNCDKLDKPCRRHRRETPVYRIKIKKIIKRFSAETMNAQSSGAASIDQHLSSPETRRCFAPTMARTIAMLRPLCFAKWDRYFYFSGQQWLGPARPMFMAWQKSG